MFRYILKPFLLLVVLVVLSYLSFHLGNVTNSLLLYLPLVLGIVFIHWFGGRILPVLFINGAVTLIIWGVTKFTPKLLLISTHEAAVAFVSWFLFEKLYPLKGVPRLGNTTSFLRFVILGIVIPVTINSLYVYHYGFVNADLDKVALYWLSDFITILPISTALLFYIDFNRVAQQFQLKPIGLSKRTVLELIALTIIFFILSWLIPFDKYWFIYGIGATLFALRWGFTTAIILNLIIFLFSYFLPLFEFASSLLITRGSTQFTSVHLGMGTMMFVSLLVGRVVTDLRTVEKNLKSEKERIDTINIELQETNQELDRFVYSVSHDLSAPLKSIKGLVTISRMDMRSVPEYLDKIDKSVNRLEDFINEVLDYSRTNRKSLEYEEIQVNELICDIRSKLEFLENYVRIEFRHDLQTKTLTTDKFLLRVALSNIISNAIKYQKKYKEHKPCINFRTFETGSHIAIEVSDNGEGIKDQYKDKLFNMFYRGTATSSGSGLGLYIAKEAVQKLGGSITVESTWGEGSAFLVQIPIERKDPG
ncbi:MAG: GHKL domain-containing protein [Cyclobacteriaceae bacterium]|nr:GHKL domain-containing protein [Cyclobacteriaceae bacterium]